MFQTVCHLNLSWKVFSLCFTKYRVYHKEIFCSRWFFTSKTLLVSCTKREIWRIIWLVKIALIVNASNHFTNVLEDGFKIQKDNKDIFYFLPSIILQNRHFQRHRREIVHSIFCCFWKSNFFSDYE